MNINGTNDPIESNMDIIENIDCFEDASEKRLKDINALQISEELSRFDKDLSKNKIDYLSLFLSHFKEYTSNQQKYLDAIKYLKTHQCIMSI